MNIKVEKLTEEQLVEKGVKQWPIWEKEASVFDWHYDDTEECYLLEGKVKVKTATETVEFGAGDFVTFPRDLDCNWEIIEDVRKHYNFL